MLVLELQQLPQGEQQVSSELSQWSRRSRAGKSLQESERYTMHSVRLRGEEAMEPPRQVALTAPFMKVGSCDSARAQREREASIA